MDLLDSIQQLDDFPALEALAEALWRRDAALMVGAGFSRMSDTDVGTPPPPLWSDFQDLMSKSLGYAPSSAPDALRLAQEYEALHNRNGLDLLIHSKVTDQRWRPSSNHQALLELPWQDILTTNWDTLLERTETATPDRIYQQVLGVQDIAKTRSPRIIKLHGTIGATPHLIFTEDDYRTYPKRYAPFVNLAQQIMLEHEVCLLGFSGVDPNFLAWSGWVRDMLGNAARNIRLVGVLNLSPSNRTLLMGRNTTPIDLAPLVKSLPSEVQHKKATVLFLEALTLLRPPSLSKWHHKFAKDLSQPTVEHKSKPEIADVASAWVKDREAFPGWIVLPRRERGELDRLTQYVDLKQDGNPNDQDTLVFCTQRIWRCFMSHRLPTMQDIKRADELYDANKSALSKTERRELCAASAFEARKFRRWEEWTRWLDRLTENSDQQSQFERRYEEARRAELEWDDKELAAAIADLESDEPIWMLRRASLLTTLLHDKEAAQLYEAALRTIRSRLQRFPQSIYLTSLEGWANFFHRSSYGALKQDLSAWPVDNSEETELRLFTAKADPWEIIQDFDRQSAEIYERNLKDNEPWLLNFEVGSYREGGVNRIGGNSVCPFYGLLEILERVGAPVSVDHMNVFSSRLLDAFMALDEPNEDDLAILLSRLRTPESKCLDRFLRRIDIARLSQEFVEWAFKVICSRVERLLSERKLNGHRSRHEDSATFLLDLLSRLAIRANSAKAHDIFEWAVKLLDTPKLLWTCFKPLEQVLRRSLEAMEYNERAAAVETAIFLRFPSEVSTTGRETDWPEVVEEFNNKDFSALRRSEKLSSRIDEIISICDHAKHPDRGYAILRLRKLHKAKLLTEAQQTALENAIWKHTNEYGWPIETRLFSWVFLELPGAERAEAAFKKNIIDNFSKDTLNSESLMSLKAGLDNYNGDIAQTTLLKVFDACLKWQPKPEPDDPFGFSNSSIASENQQVASEIGYTLTSAILPRLDISRISKAKLKAWKAKLAGEEISSMVATVPSLLRSKPEEIEFCVQAIQLAIASRTSRRLAAAYFAIQTLIEEPIKGLDVQKRLASIVLTACEKRDQPGLTYAMITLRKVISSNLLPETDLGRVRNLIETILLEYSYTQKALDVPSVATLPLVRAEVRKVIEALDVDDGDPLFFHLKVLREDPLPEVRLAS